MLEHSAKNFGCQVQDQLARLGKTNVVSVNCRSSNEGAGAGGCGRGGATAAWRHLRNAQNEVAKILEIQHTQAQNMGKGYSTEKDFSRIF